VKKFREGGYNTLVSTCVGEEGLDIGEVDLIVCFDAQKSPIRLVQRMGRTGRKREGRIVVLLSEGKEESSYKTSLSKKKNIYNSILNGQKNFDFYKSNPLMIPRGPKPKCEKKLFTIEQEKNANDEKSKDATIDKQEKKKASRKKNEKSEIEGEKEKRKKNSKKSMEIDEHDIDWSKFNDDLLLPTQQVLPVINFDWITTDAQANIKKSCEEQNSSSEADKIDSDDDFIKSIKQSRNSGGSIKSDTMFVNDFRQEALAKSIFKGDSILLTTAFDTNTAQIDRAIVDDTLEPVVSTSIINETVSSSHYDDPIRSRLSINKSDCLKESNTINRPVEESSVVQSKSPLVLKKNSTSTPMRSILKNAFLSKENNSNKENYSLVISAKDNLSPTKTVQLEAVDKNNKNDNNHDRHEDLNNNLNSSNNTSVVGITQALNLLNGDTSRQEEIKENFNMKANLLDLFKDEEENRTERSQDRLKNNSNNLDNSVQNNRYMGQNKNEINEDDDDDDDLKLLEIIEAHEKSILTTNTNENNEIVILNESASDLLAITVADVGSNDKNTRLDNSCQIHDESVIMRKKNTKRKLLLSTSETSLNQSEIKVRENIDDYDEVIGNNFDGNLEDYMIKYAADYEYEHDERVRQNKPRKVKA
jgi:hypothetical protein